MAAVGSPTPALRVRGMSKTFPGQRALFDLSMEVQPGEIHGLVGENGSGKSTFIKCLAGYHQPDPGAEIEVNGEALPAKYAPSQARSFGLTFVHQDLGLIPTLSVAENLAVGRGFATGPGGWIRWRTEQRRAGQLLARVTDRVSPRSLVRDLSRADQTFVALAKVIQDDDMTLAVFDEPTAALTAADIPRLFAAIRELAARGVAVIYVSHRLGEVLELTENVTVLRDGVVTASFPTSSVNQEELVRHIVGHDSVVTRDRPLGELGERTAAPALRLSGLAGPGVEDVTLDIYPGEIVGLAGLLGSGRTELANLIFGVTQATAGTVAVAGQKVTIKRPADAIRHGIALVPEDRLSVGSFQTLSVSDNVTLLKLDKFTRAGRRLSRSRERRYAKDILEEFQVRPSFPERQLRFLSGGNQQKAILGKWMHEHPRVLLLDEPTQGIDIGAKAEVARLIQGAAKAGVAVLVIDSELENLVTIADRIAVMRDGRLVDELDAGSLSRERILKSAFSEKVVERLERLEQGV